MPAAFNVLALSSFRSFIRAANIDLRGQGLTYVAGYNLVEPALGANGAGKTTLLEALYWVLFGKTSRNLRASDVSSWDTNKTTRVMLDFVGTDGKAHGLIRTWNPVALTLDGVPCAQEQVETLIGYSATTFLYAVFHAQFADYFADLQAAQQLEIYTEVLGLDLWEAASEESATRANAADKEAHSSEVAMAGIRAKVFERRRQVASLEALECEWHRDRLMALRECWDALYDAEQEVAKADVALHKLKPSQAEEDNVAKMSEILTEKKRKELTAQFQVDDLNKERARLLNASDSLSEISRCPKCFQEVNQATAEKYIVHAIATVEKRLKSDSAALAALVEEVEAYQEKYDRVKADRAKAKEKQREESISQEAAARTALQTLKRLRFEIEDLAAKDCPFDTKEARKDAQFAEEALLIVRNALAAARQQVAGYEFWTKAFREIRLALIKSSLAQFEVVTNSALQQLGLEDWAIEYAVEAETKGGKLRRGFSIAVRSPYNDGPVPFTTWSGGEAQRLRLAVAFGLSDLIQDFSGASCNLEIFDEPTAHLSESGIQDLLAVLEQRAKQRRTGVWLVDHHALDFGGFARIVTVSKTEKGSQIG